MTKYTYDSVGNLIKTERPDGSVLTETYDENNRLIQTKDVGTDGTVTHEFSYNANGNYSNVISSIL